MGNDGRLDANGGQQGGQRVHPHIVYLWHDADRVRTCPSGYGHLATCDETDPKKQPPISHEECPKVHDMWVKSVAAHPPFPGIFSCQFGRLMTVDVNSYDKNPCGRTLTDETASLCAYRNRTRIYIHKESSKFFIHTYPYITVHALTHLVWSTQSAPGSCPLRNLCKTKRRRVPNGRLKLQAAENPKARIE